MNRLKQAIFAVRIFGRNSDTMGELYDSLNARRERKASKLAADREFAALMKKCRV